MSISSIPSSLSYQVHMSKQAQVLNSVRLLESLGLNRGASGNVSIRSGNGFLITPSGVIPNQMSAGEIVQMSISGDILSLGKPSSEWRFHCDIYAVRPEIGAIVHVHSLAATAFSTLRKDLPPFHYMIAVAGGDNVRCAPYALFGTQVLSDLVIRALDDRKACLLANHGMIAVGQDIEEAMAIAVEVESLCAQFMLASQVGEPSILDPEQMAEVIEKFKTYGRQSKEKSDDNQIIN
jgi:L-fuculose-phosphate aldolase